MPRPSGPGEADCPSPSGPEHRGSDCQKSCGFRQRTGVNGTGPRGERHPPRGPGSQYLWPAVLSSPCQQGEITRQLGRNLLPGELWALPLALHKELTAAIFSATTCVPGASPGQDFPDPHDHPCGAARAPPRPAAESGAAPRPRPGSAPHLLRSGPWQLGQPGRSQNPGFKIKLKSWLKKKQLFPNS